MPHAHGCRRSVRSRRSIVHDEEETETMTGPPSGTALFSLAAPDQFLLSAPFGHEGYSDEFSMRTSCRDHKSSPSGCSSRT